MTLKEIRKLFVQMSGRYDLVTDAESYDDNGANALIRGGLRYLSGAVVSPTETRRVELSLSAGTVSKLVPDARALHSVAVSDSDYDGGWRVLEKITGTRLANEFKDASASESPIFWAVRGTETEATDSYERRFLDYFDPALSYSSDLKLYIGPPCSTDLTLGIEGLFVETMPEEHSECWWSIKHPLIVVTAAMMWAEVFNRNREGVLSFYEQIELLTLPISRDVVAQDVAENSQMRNSW